MYDSTIDTKEHIQNVISECRKFIDNLKTYANISFYKPHIYSTELNNFITKLTAQVSKHDASKLIPPEKEGFDKYTPMLAKMAYGSDEYKKCRNELQHPYLDHHYANNRHHPEHFTNGVLGMNLFDLIEMLCDWKAAVKRNKDGDIYKSIEINTKRFKLDTEMHDTLVNTVNNDSNLYTLYDVVIVFIYKKSCNKTMINDCQLNKIINNTLKLCSRNIK